MKYLKQAKSRRQTDEPVGLKGLRMTAEEEEAEGYRGRGPGRRARRRRGDDEQEGDVETRRCQNPQKVGKCLFTGTEAGK